MELNKFITLALTEICEGIAEARTNIEAKYDGNCIIAPANLDGVKAYSGTNEISFDLAIQIEEERERSAKGNVGLIKILNVVNVGVGAAIKKKVSEKTFNRVTFSVPFIPQGLRKTQKKYNSI